MSELSKPSRCAIGIDLGTKTSRVCMIEEGAVRREFSVTGTPAAFAKAFEPLPRHDVIMEVGTSSPWVSRLLQKLGFKVQVVAPTILKQVFHRGRRKNDRDDAKALAQIAISCPEIPCGVEHHSEQIQRDLAVVQQRAVLVQVRTLLINSVRGTMSSLGVRIPSCSTAAFPKRASAVLSTQDQRLVEGMMGQIVSLNKEIRTLERQIDEIAAQRYAVTQQLTQVHGVGTLTALVFVLIVVDPKRFKQNRKVGSYLGLVPRQHQSGGSDPQLRITKAGDRQLRCLLVQCAQFILGPFGKDSDLRRFGLEIAARGGKNAKKRAVIAVARKLSVLLLSLWRTGEVYEPLRHEQTAPSKQTA